MENPPVCLLLKDVPPPHHLAPQQEAGGLEKAYLGEGGTNLELSTCPGVRQDQIACLPACAEIYLAQGKFPRRSEPGGALSRCRRISLGERRRDHRSYVEPSQSLLCLYSILQGNRACERVRGWIHRSQSRFNSQSVLRLKFCPYLSSLCLP